MYQYAKGNDNYRWKGIGEISAHLFHSIKVNASKRNLDFNITIKDLWALFLKQNKKCAYTGEFLKFGTSHLDRNVRTASLDRIDSSIGYKKNNIQWIHKDVNDIKWDLENNTFLKKCYFICYPDASENKNEECIVRRYNNSWKGFGNIGRTYFNQVIKGASSRNLNFNVTIKDLWELFLKQNGKCALTGEDLKFGYKKNQTASLDRVNNSIGYEKNNIQWVHKDINTKLKKYITEDELKKICIKIINYNKEFYENQTY